MEKTKNISPQEANLLKTAKEQLLEGTKANGEWQKPIRIMDMSEYRWPVAEAYQMSNKLVTGEINVKRFEEAVKSVEKTFQLGRKRGRDDDCKREPKKYPHPMYYEGP